MTLPWPRVTSSTWAIIAHRTNRKKPTETATMISRAPDKGSRRRAGAGESPDRKGMVAIEFMSLTRRERERRGGRDLRGCGGALLRGVDGGRRRPAFLRGGDAEGPALARIQQAADVVRRSLQYRPIADRARD